MNSPTYSILVHTFNGYKHLWDGFFNAFDPYAMHIDNSEYLMFGTDVYDGTMFPLPWTALYSGPGEWSDRLLKLLDQIPSEYIFYMQEDHWPFSYLPNLDSFVIQMKEDNLLRVQFSPLNQYYHLTGIGWPLKFHHTSKYLVSHQPSLWKKSFLQECLLPGETPWHNEYAGTLRLKTREDIRGKIGIYPMAWFNHVCVKGVFNPPPIQ